MDQTQVISDDLLILAGRIVEFFENGGKFEDVYYHFNYQAFGLNIARLYEISRLTYLKQKITELHLQIGELLLANETLRRDLEKVKENGTTTK